jgi:26S proteasome regulatory subunit T1
VESEDELAADHCVLNSDIQVLKTYGAAPYTSRLKGVEKELKELQQKINEKIGM